MKREFRLRIKEHELIGLPNLYCLKDTVMNYINMGTTQKFVEDNVNFTPHSKESLSFPSVSVKSHMDGFSMWQSGLIQARILSINTTSRGYIQILF